MAKKQNRELIRLVSTADTGFFYTTRRKKGRDTVAGVPSRFIGEMKLHEATTKEDPRERLKKLRAELAAKAGAPQSP